MKIIDLHGFRFKEGLQLIISTLNACLIAQEIKIQIIHGYHTPTFKNYIQSAKFLRVMENEGFFLRKLPSNFNPWYNNIYTRIKRKNRT